MGLSVEVVPAVRYLALVYKLFSENNKKLIRNSYKFNICLIENEFSTIVLIEESRVRLKFWSLLSTITARDMNKTIILLAIAGLVSSLGWSIYYTVSRPYYSDFLGLSYSSILVIASSEWMPGLTSFIWGYLGDKIGHKRVLMLGFLSFTLSLIGYINPVFIPIVVGLASLGWAAVWPIILASISRISPTGRVGRSYSMFAIGTSSGWGLGGVVGGILDTILGVRVVLVVAGLLIGLAYASTIIILRSTNFTYENISIRLLVKKYLLLLAISSIVLTISIDYAFNLISVKLFYELNEDVVLYGLFLTTIPAILGALFRPLAGIIVDKIGGLKTVVLASILYTIIYITASVSKGLLLGIIWIIPIYPFYDTGLVKLASEVSKDYERGTVMGLINASNSVAGSLMFVLGPLTDVLGYTYSMWLSACIALATLVPLAILNRFLKHSNSS